MTTFEDQVAATVATYDFFAMEKPVWIARAPGRLDVMGGNVDYTGGMVLQGLLREAVWVALQPQADDTIRLLNPGAEQFGWESSLEFSTADLDDPASLRLLCNRRAGSSWACYVLGALYFLKSHYGCGTGADLFLASDIGQFRQVH